MSGAPDLLKHLGGVPVGSASRYAGWWGNTFRFVDFDNGTAGSTGTSMKDTQKNLATAISDSDKWDVIYVRPRDPDDTGDPQAITPATAVNWNIPQAKYGLSIIGTGIGSSPHVAAYKTRLQGESTVTTVAPMTVLAPYVVLENLSFKRGGATGVPLVELGSATAAAFAAEVNRCQFHMGNGTAAGAGALQISSHWYASVQGCHFERCNLAIGITSILSNPKGVHIVGNTFNQAIASNYGDIVSGATLVERILIAENYFLHEIPTHAGGKADYIWFQGTCTGSVANNYFGTATLVTGTIMTLSGIIESGSRCALGFLTS